MRVRFEKSLKGVFFALTAAVLAQLVSARIRWLGNHPHPTAVDAYYYLQDFRHLLEHGRGYYTPYSPFLFAAEVIGRCFGLNEFSLFSAIVLLSLALLSLSLGIFFLRVEGRWILPAMLSIPWISDLLFLQTYSYPRMFLSLGLLCSMLSALLVSGDILSQPRAPIRRKLAFLAGLAFSASMHAISAAIAVFWAILNYARSWKAALTLLGIFSATVAGYAAMTGKTLFAGYGLRWGTVVAVPCGAAACTPGEAAEFWIFLFTWIGTVIYLFARRPKERSVYIFPLAVVLLKLPVWDASSWMALRFSIVSLWLIAFSWGVTFLFDKRKQVASLCCAAICSLFFLAADLYISPHADARPDVEIISKNAEDLKRLLPEDCIIIAPHGVEFAITYYTGRASTNRLPKHAKYSMAFELRHEVSEPGKCVRLEPAANFRAAPPECIVVDERGDSPEKQGHLYLSRYYAGMALESDT